ncbi:hypothetical protein ABZ912_57005 [Nonomuraea angiospora]|uniref:hypothetical protein n=1 Tax=Nonomuraea angiospora TaxID=46172 RepID=UPI0033F2E701
MLTAWNINVNSIARLMLGRRALIVKGLADISCRAGVTSARLTSENSMPERHASTPGTDGGSYSEG